MTKYSQFVVQSCLFSEDKIWNAVSSISALDAKNRVYELAVCGGWYPPMWWQWWRIYDTKLHHLKISKEGLE